MHETFFSFSLISYKQQILLNLIKALRNEGVYHYRIWNVVGYKIPGMSEVTMMYNRPTKEDLIEAIEIIAK